MSVFVVGAVNTVGVGSTLLVVLVVRWFLGFGFSPSFQKKNLDCCAVVVRVTRTDSGLLLRSGGNIGGLVLICFAIARAFVLSVISSGPPECLRL